MSSAGFPTPLRGQCRCGRIRYQVTKAPRFTFACHCSDCQQLTSSAFSLGMAVDESAFALEGDPHCWQKTGDSGGWSRQFTCPDCTGWTHTTTQGTAGLVIVRPTTLYDHSWFRPIAQLFTRSALPWALMPVQFSFEKEFEDPAPIEKAFALGGIAPGMFAKAAE